jgi:magnesium-protoporphyrin IX monomethyl ester (oxidative) cyclase
MASSAMELSLLNPAATHRHRGGLAAAGLPLAPRRSVVRFRVSATAAAAAPPKSSGPKKRGKTEIQETLLTPRFYTTDFDEMERLFNAEINKQLNQAEFDALLQEFKTDYNQTHFVRNPEFKAAADKMEGPLRQIFVEFLERSCTAEFSGFLLYKELGRRLKVPSCFFLCLPRLVSSRLVHFLDHLVGVC